MSLEVQTLRRTRRSWFEEICNYRLAGVTRRSVEQLDHTDQMNRLRIRVGLNSGALMKERPLQNPVSHNRRDIFARRR